MNDVLQAILIRADLQDTQFFGAHEVAQWPDGALDWLTKAGILLEAEPAEEILCEECQERCWIKPKIRVNPQTGQKFGVYYCQQNDVGRFTVDLERKRQWRFSLAGLATAVAHAIGTIGQQVEVVPERLVLMGTANLDDKSREFFLARGVAWPDSKDVFCNASRLRASPHPVVLTLVTMPPQDLLPGTSLAARPLAEIAAFDNGELSITIEGAIPATEPWPKVVAAKLPAQNQADADKPTHSADFTSVDWYGTKYQFTKGQADAVRMLWENWENGTPSLSQGTIGEAVSGVDQFRLRDLFRTVDVKAKKRKKRSMVLHPAWGKMIVSCGKGIFKLNPPS